MIEGAKGFQGLVLAVHPTSRGFGWVLFESPSSPVDWGVASAKQGRTARLVRRFERLLNRYEPAVLALEEFEGRDGRAPRIQKLCKQFISLAGVRDMETPVYRRAVVQAVFAGAGAATRYEIAQVIAKQLDALSHRLPRKRRPWENEDPRQSLFDAAALALTYFSHRGEYP